ncbi:MAG: ABC transporter permease [Acidimicrobiales bacterium]
MTTSPAPVRPYRLRDAMASEWVKLTTVRSYRLVLAAFALVTVGIGVAVSAATGAGWHHASHHGFDPTNHALAGLAFGELAMGVLGVLTVTGEYSTGAIRSTLAAIPRRPVVLAAKAAVYGAVALVVGEVVTVATFLAGQAAMGAAPHANFGQPGVARAVLLSGAFLPLLGLFGLGLGAIVRNSAAGVGLFAALVLVLPPALYAISSHAVKYAPEDILSSSVASVVHQSDTLSPWVGFGLVAAYAAAAIVIGLVVLVRRDA